MPLNPSSTKEAEQEDHKSMASLSYSKNPTLIFIPIFFLPLCICVYTCIYKNMHVYIQIYMYVCDSGSLNMAPLRSCYLHVWSSTDRTIWEGLGDVTLLEKLCHCGHALKFQKVLPFPVSSLCLVLSQLSATAAVPCLLPFYTHDDHGRSLSL